MSDQWIPKAGEWTFRDPEVAKRFNRHVREQLPWYDLATDGVIHFARHYVPKNGLVYDIGASTGNIGRAIADVITSRHASLVGIEESEEMVKLYDAPGEVIIADAVEFDYQPFDFAVCFLVFMFLPVAHRGIFAQKLIRLIRPGGALLIVDKISTPNGYVGTAMRRMTMQWKVKTGTPPEDIIAKELSLAGAQRPISDTLFGPHAVRWFQLGEFTGWIIDKDEQGCYSLAETEHTREVLARLRIT